MIIADVKHCIFNFCFFSFASPDLQVVFTDKGIKKFFIVFKLLAAARVNPESVFKQLRVLKISDDKCFFTRLLDCFGKTEEIKDNQLSFAEAAWDEMPLASLVWILSNTGHLS